MSEIGLPMGSRWPSSLRIEGIETYIVLGSCTGCNASSGQRVIDMQSEVDKGTMAVYYYEDAELRLRVPDGVINRAIPGSIFKTLGLTVDSPPYVFNVHNGQVTGSGPASNYVKTKNSLENQKNEKEE